VQVLQVPSFYLERANFANIDNSTSESKTTGGARWSDPDFSYVDFSTPGRMLTLDNIETLQDKIKEPVSNGAICSETLKSASNNSMVLPRSRLEVRVAFI
jgi:hypothetical protein